LKTNLTSFTDMFYVAKRMCSQIRPHCVAHHTYLWQ